MTFSYKELGETICALRKHQNLSQENLACAVGISRTSITNIEKGRQSVFIHTLLLISETLNRDLMELLK